ncbi:MAG TPA: tRNA 2-thiouridine(34) synthase MnmA [Pseudobdellovibrionaceae bacterium]|nr:tRNA 2-thiouridine(34) synthase MnmA [Pseudobdellovibrionaceae bacterium]
MKLNMENKNINEKNKRVLVAMSGGVDSSVAAALLKDQGYEVIGATMQVWDYSQCEVEEGTGTCCSSLDVDDARAVANQLDIPFFVLNCEEQFKISVINPFINDYLQGKTPVPCVNCNTYLKFDHLIQKMKELDCQYLATGHYAQIIQLPNGESAIQTSSDDWKDQTYFLFTIDPKIIPHLIFPVGGYTKPEVRKIAESKNIQTARKKDSTGICFLGNQSYQDFIQQHATPEQLAHKNGSIREYPSGQILGSHRGIHEFTYGQSKGLGLTHHEKLFVIKTDLETQTVWVGPENYLYKKEMVIRDPHWLTTVKSGEELRVKIRLQHQSAKARIEKLNERDFKIEFEEPQRAITPGQAAVFYRDQQLLGGGWIL